MSGLFLSFDGIDGCGKSTQIELLSQWIDSQGQSAVVVRDPGGTKLGEALRDILLHRQEIPLNPTAEMLLYMASRAQLVREVVQPALMERKIVIADRFLLANVVYQGSGGGLNPADIWQVGKIATEGLMPAHTFILDIAPDIARQRLPDSLDRLESRGLQYMQRVREGFLDQSSHLADRVTIIPAEQSIDEIHNRVVAKVAPLIQRQL